VTGLILLITGLVVTWFGVELWLAPVVEDDADDRRDL